MAVEEAMLTALREWAEIEPYLTAEQLAAIARTGRSAVEDDGRERLLGIFRVIITAALPRDHHIREAMLAQRSAPRSVRRSAMAITLELADRAADALDSPGRAAEKLADSLEEESGARLLRFGALPASRAPAEGQHLLSLHIGGQIFYPSFQFVSQEHRRQHDIVGRLWHQLGADADAVGAVAWWLTPNPWLAARPADLLGTARESEIGYAADQLANDNW